LLFHALLQVPGGGLAPLSVTFDATGSRDPDPGDTISFSGHATDAEEGSLPPSALRWSLVLHHCTTPSDCHVHPLQDFPAVDGGSFAAPDHEYPSWLKLSLTVTDSGGLSDEASVRLDPKTVNLTFTSTPHHRSIPHTHLRQGGRAPRGGRLEQRRHRQPREVQVGPVGRGRAIGCGAGDRPRGGLPPAARPPRAQQAGPRRR
jgi:hypothetical protein